MSTGARQTDIAGQSTTLAMNILTITRSLSSDTGFEPMGRSSFGGNLCGNVKHSMDVDGFRLHRFLHFPNISRIKYDCFI
jgi:hypothetical protein